MSSKMTNSIRFVIIFFGILVGGPAWTAPKGSPWGADYFPNVTLVTQEGKKVRFYDDLLKGKVVAINFIYTHCVDSCSLETARLLKVEKLLNVHMGKEIFFYSISLDPKNDTPATLKNYAQKFNTGPGWTFLTGKEKDITLLRKKLGLYSTDADAKQLSNHSTSFMIGNEASGQWIRRSPYDDSKILARLFVNRLLNLPEAHDGEQDYATATTKYLAPGKGQEIFNSRCESCHSLTTAEGIGPGLAGIMQRRDKTWLVSWLKAPNKLIESGDPVAVGLYNQYKQIMMPNSRLSDQDIEALLAFMTQSTSPPIEHEHSAPL